MAFLNRAKQVRRGTVRNFQAELQSAEQRQQEGREGTTLRRAFEQRRRIGGAARATKRIDQASLRRPRALDRLAAISPALREAVVHS